MTLEGLYYLAGIGSFLVALFGFIGLVWYVVETHKLRLAAQKQLQAAQAQVEAAQRQVAAAQEQLEAAVKPCVLVFGDAKNESVEAPLYLKNAGAGVALNLHWRFSNNQDKPWNEFPALGPGESVIASFRIKDVINNGSVECTFESVSGWRYWTLSGFSPNTQNLDFRHQFKRLSETELPR